MLILLIIKLRKHYQERQAASIYLNRKIFIYNNNKKHGTMRRIDTRIKLEELHMRAVFSGKFSFLFHIFSKVPSSSIKKNIKSAKTDPIETDPKISQTDFKRIKKEFGLRRI